MSYHIVSIDSPQCSLSCKDGQLTCKSADGERKLPLEDVASIIITSFSASIHSHLFLEAAKHGVALIICEAFKPVSLVLPANRSTDTLLSRALLNLTEATRLQMWQKTIDAKCRNQYLLAAHVAPEDARLESFRASTASRKPHKEAICAKAFWQVFGSAAKCAEFRREPQERRPPARPDADNGIPRPTRESEIANLKPGRVSNGKSGISNLRSQIPAPAADAPGQAELLLTGDEARGRMNDLLNYGYAVLLSSVLQKLFAVGLDPTWGLSHVARERCTPLAYDIMEPFRPCVDWRVFQWMRDHPDRTEWEVSKEYRRWVTGFPLERIEYLDFTLEIQGVIEGVVRSFRRAVMENAVKPYRPWNPKPGQWPPQEAGGPGPL